MNGSSATGNCANISGNTSETLTCADPTSSVLFDDPRGMPILTELDSDLWASQLLTIQKTASSIDITFDFHKNVTVNRIEMVMFNCPQKKVGVQTVQIFERNSSILLSTTNIFFISCASLVRVCFHPRITVQVPILNFNPPPPRL